MSTHLSVTGTHQEATGMHSNIRTEIGVKSAKRMIMENTGPQGDVDIPAFQRAMLVYRNTPMALENRSPSEIVFGRQIRDFVPVMPGKKYEPCYTWKDTTANREKALMECHAKEVEALLPHTRKMPPLKVGNSARIQNQTGKSGQDVEVRQNDQYAIKVHGSGRVAPRSRQFLRLYISHTEKPCPRRITDDIPNRPADIGRLPLSLFPTEDLTWEISSHSAATLIAHLAPRQCCERRSAHQRTVKDSSSTLTASTSSPTQRTRTFRGPHRALCRENNVPGCAATDDDYGTTIRRPTRHDVPTGQAKAADAHADPLQKLRVR